MFFIMTNLGRALTDPGSDRSHPFTVDTSLKTNASHFASPHQSHQQWQFRPGFQSFGRLPRSLKLQFWAWADPSSLSDASVAAYEGDEVVILK